MTSLPSNVPSPAPPDKTLNKPPGTSLFDRIQQFKEISNVKTETKEEKNVPVKMEDVDIKTDPHTGESRGFGFLLYKELCRI